MKIAVAGGTGVAGRWTVEALRAAGHEAIVISRSAGADLVTGAGLDAALAGVDAVIDATNVASSGKRASSEFFEATARTLMRTAAAACVRHIVALSIIGIDRVPYGYYQGKLRQEQVLQESPVPVSILRAAQFHEFAGQYLAKMPGPVVIVPRWRAAKEQPGDVIDSVLVNGAPGFAVCHQGELVTIVSVTVAAGRVTRLDFVRAPDKLAGLAR
jgi:uncharacterized protein YbjT (DUF2867 family)